MNQVKKPLSIYIHIPFCRQACPYCAFYKEVCETEDLTDFYLRDLKSLESDFSGFELKTIYFGGGTPSLMSPQFFEKMIQKIRALFSVSSALEITIEINPKTISVDGLSDLKVAGLTRPSFGVQSLRSDSLKKLGRIHSVEDALVLIEKSRSLFKTFSADFIYGLPWQTPEVWRKELTEIVALDIPHLSLYSLSLEPKTPFSKHYTESQLDGGEFYEITQEILSQKKYRHYEISNFARTDADLSQHNLAYWLGHSYFGLGPSAHGRVHVSPKKWIAT
ncbi:MAG: radical SAM family heme chaperone HemW, partial [Alphaproteobacteria bacterium]